MVTRQESSPGAGRNALLHVSQALHRAWVTHHGAGRGDFDNSGAVAYCTVGGGQS